MDAAEDRDIKFQRASADLIKDLSENLPSLLWKSRVHNGQNIQVARRWAQAAKTERLISLLEPFQEWPQLLDPHLQKLLPPLVDAFLAYLVKYRKQYASREVPKTRRQGELYPLPRAICKLLYTFCKVRGVKVISRFLNNEPKYLDPLLRAFIQWDAVSSDDSIEVPSGDGPKRLVWEERYVILLWLSHLLLAPFDLASMSSDDIPIPHSKNLGQLKTLFPETPTVAKSLLSVSLEYVNVPGKEREAATVLLARLALRRDMQVLGLLDKLTDWAFSTIQPAEGKAELPSVYTCIGVLSFLARLGASSQVEDFVHLVVPIFERTLRIAQADSDIYKAIRSSASARKLIIKILRTFTVMALSLSERGDGSLTDDKVSSILEDAIDHFLVALADNDTPVRFAASKALSIITLRLDADMAAEVIEAVIGSLEENILYEKRDATLVTPFEARRIGLSTLKRNLSAVDAQRWQGLLLTLAHLLFRRAPPPHQLPSVLQSLVSGLDFEQRSSTGSSVGTGVRDASCFGIWALSRKYTTKELLALEPRSIQLSTTDQGKTSVVQMLAMELVRAACVDPSGNIRRGASAALQELVGRHPDTILEGIPLVQVVDYHAVARRSRAMIDVAKETAALNPVYWSPLVESLMGWRGIGSPDAESRRQAARAIGSLSTRESYKTMKKVLQLLLDKLSSIPRSDTEARHGCLLSMAATVDAYSSQREAEGGDRDSLDASDVSHQVANLWEVFDSSYGPTQEDLTLQTARPELTAEASSRIISSLSRSIHRGSVRPSAALLDKALQILSLCVSRGEDIAIEASSDALSELFRLLPPSKQEETVRQWIAHIQATAKLPTGRGQILALGTVFKRVEPEHGIRESIIGELLRCARKDELIEKRVAAVKCLATEILPHIAITEDVADHFVEFLNDYTTDRRGDVGSLIRVEALQGAKIILEKGPGLTTHPGYAQKLIGCMCRLAAEKLDKVRLQAWLCLQGFWKSGNDFPPLRRTYEHFSHVSSPDYFAQLLELQRVDWLRLPLIQGLATSAVAGAEGLIRASRSALVQYINAYEGGERQTVVITLLLGELMAILSENLHDDRYAIPAMELTAFLIDGYISSVSADLEPSFRKLFILTQKAHFKSSNIARLEAAIKVYAPLARLEQLRPDVIKKLTGMLLHPFPRVRAAVADYLFMETGSDIIKNEDWTRQPKQIKGEVERLRKMLVV